MMALNTFKVCFSNVKQEQPYSAVREYYDQAESCFKAQSWKWNKHPLHFGSASVDIEG